MSEAPVPDSTTPLRYELVRSRRRTLAIHVLPGGSLEVRAPLRTPVRTISAFVESKRAWILRTLGKRVRNDDRVLWHEDPLCDGDIVHFHGIAHRVRPVPRTTRSEKLIPVPGGATGAMAVVLVPVRDAEDPIRPQILAWYRRDLAERVRLALPEAVRRVGVSPAAISYRLARSRWGSCGSKGRISLNLLCAALPYRLFEYVLVHELCHLRHLDHSRAFWASLLAVLPDAVERRRELRGWYLR